MLEEVLDNELHLAVRISDLQGTQKALEAGCDPNEIGLFEWSSVHEAAYNGDVEILKVLLQYGGNCNERDLLNGSTALHYVAAEGHPQCLELLMSKGGNASIQDDKGQTAPNITHHKGCKEVFAKFGIDIVTSVHFEDQPCNERLRKADTMRYIYPIDSSSYPKRGLEAVLSDDSYESGIGSKTSLTDGGSISSLILKPSRVKVDDHSSSSETPLSSCKSVSSFGSLTSIGSSIISASDDCAGYIYMAFQYNSKTSRLKMCIAEIVLTCLLPLQRSRKVSTMVLYMSGRIINPNDAKIDGIRNNMKTKSEPFKLHPGGSQENPVKDSDESVETFWSGKTAYVKFKPLLSIEFINASKDIVREYDIQISICTRQKRSLLKNASQGVPIARFQMPLKQAVKHLMRELYELQLCSVLDVTRDQDHLEQVFPTIVVDGVSVKSNSVIQGHRIHLVETERSANDGDLKLSSVDHSNIESPSSSCFDIEATVSESDFTLTEVTTHSAPTSPQVRIKSPPSYKSSLIGQETKLDIPTTAMHSTGRDSPAKPGRKLREAVGDKTRALRTLITARNVEADEEMESQENSPIQTMLTCNTDPKNNLGSVVYEKSETYTSKQTSSRKTHRYYASKPTPGLSIENVKTTEESKMCVESKTTTS